jgi:hypothetical protein
VHAEEKGRGRFPGSGRGSMVRYFDGLVYEYSSYRLVYDNKRNFAEAYTRSVRVSPDFSASDGGIEGGHAGSCLEGCKSILINLGRNRIEQDAEADLLTVMLFANVRLVVEQKSLWFGKKAHQLAQAA